MAARAPGTLYLVGTPIGNLGDMTLRAIDTLRTVDRVAAEDTRRTRALLSHLGIAGKPLTSLDANASDAAVLALVEHILDGESVAFATDAGMPAVSDPGAKLVREAARRGVGVTVVPGPSAVTAAVALSGLVEASYSFFGFLPRSGKKRGTALARIEKTAEPVVLFESPNRTQATLDELARHMPERAAVVCRELTKLHEEALRGSLSEIAAEAREWRGEVVIVLGPGPERSAEQLPDEAALDARIRSELAAGRSTKDVVGALHSWSGLAKRELYARVEALRVRS